jgi:hypothetical protein
MLAYTLALYVLLVAAFEAIIFRTFNFLMTPGGMIFTVVIAGIFTGISRRKRVKNG